MSNITRNTEKEYRYCVIEGGNDSDPDPERTGRVRLRDISRHGKNVKTEHLPWSQLLSNPQGQGQNEFNRPPDPGQIVLCLVPRGAGTTGYKHVIGIPITKEMADAAIPGNQSFPWAGLEDFKQKKLKINVPPNIKLTQEDGKSIYQIQEKGEKFFRALTDELPGHMASKPFQNNAGRQLKSIPTALQEAQSILDSDALSSLPGSNFSLSNLFDMIPQEAKDAMPENIQTALSNMMVLSSSSDDSGGASSGVNTGYRVNDEVFSENLGKIFGNVKTYAQLEDAISSVHEGSEIAGLESLEGITRKLMGPFGEITQNIDSQGGMSFDIPEAVKQAQESFSGLMSGINAGGSNLFGSDTKIPNDMLSRFPLETQSQFKEMLEKVSPSKNDKRGRIHNTVSGLEEVFKNFEASNPVFTQKIPFISGK
jgi:hypothetical protein